MAVIKTMEDLSHLIKTQRKRAGLSQAEFAGASGLGVRFIGDLERGKQTCEIGKTLHALAMLGIEIQLAPRDQSDE